MFQKRDQLMSGVMESWHVPDLQHLTSICQLVQIRYFVRPLFGSSPRQACEQKCVASHKCARKCTKNFGAMRDVCFSAKNAWPFGGLQNCVLQPGGHTQLGVIHLRVGKHPTRKRILEAACWLICLGLLWGLPMLTWSLRPVLRAAFLLYAHVCFWWVWLEWRWDECASKHSA